MPPIVKNTLKKIGLADKEVAVLLVLLQNGPLFASRIAQLAKLNRTTTYGILKDLGATGLVTSIAKKGAAARYQSIAPEMLPGYIERRLEELTASKKEFEEIVPQLTMLRTKGRVLPRIQYFEGAKGVEQAYEDMLEHNKAKIVYALTGLEGAVSGLDPKFQDYFVSKRARMGIKADYIVPATEIAKEATKDDAKKLRYARFIPPAYDFNTEVCIYDNKISILSYSLENPIALIIEDETIAQAMKQIFSYIWSTASEK